MENKLPLYSFGIKAFGSIATVGGVIQTFQILSTPDIDAKKILLSFPAWVVYVFILLTIILAMLRSRYKSMNQKIEQLNNQINEQNATVASLQQMMKIASFKGRYYLTTEYLYNELAQFIQNNISINTIEISNTIEKEGTGNKRNSCVHLSVQGVIKQRVSNFHLLVAGDTIVNFNDINIKASEYYKGQTKKLCARIVDNGQDSLLKQVVISYDRIKEKGDIVDLNIEWCWPNMLNIKECDYITLPNFLSSDVKHMKITLTRKENLLFKTASVYKYQVGMEHPQLVLDLDIPENTKTIMYEEDYPLVNSCYILYYEVKND